MKMKKLNYLTGVLLCVLLTGLFGCSGNTAPINVGATAQDIDAIRNLKFALNNQAPSEPTNSQEPSEPQTESVSNHDGQPRQPQYRNIEIGTVVQDANGVDWYERNDSWNSSDGTTYDTATLMRYVDETNHVYQDKHSYSLKNSDGETIRSWSYESTFIEAIDGYNHTVTMTEGDATMRFFTDGAETMKMRLNPATFSFTENTQMDTFTASLDMNATFTFDGEIYTGRFTEEVNQDNDETVFETTITKSDGTIPGKLKLLCDEGELTYDTCYFENGVCDYDKD